MSSNPYFLDARLTTVIAIHAVYLPELESVLFCYCWLNLPIIGLLLAVSLYAN